MKIEWEPIGPGVKRWAVCGGWVVVGVEVFKVQQQVMDMPSLDKPPVKGQILQFPRPQTVETQVPDTWAVFVPDVNHEWTGEEVYEIAEAMAPKDLQSKDLHNGTGEKSGY